MIHDEWWSLPATTLSSVRAIYETWNSLDHKRYLATPLAKISHWYRKLTILPIKEFSPHFHQSFPPSLRSPSDLPKKVLGAVLSPLTLLSSSFAKSAALCASSSNLSCLRVLSIGCHLEEYIGRLVRVRKRCSGGGAGTGAGECVDSGLARPGRAR